MAFNVWWIIERAPIPDQLWNEQPTSAMSMMGAPGLRISHTLHLWAEREAAIWSIFRDHFTHLIWNPKIAVKTKLLCHSKQLLNYIFKVLQRLNMKFPALRNSRLRFCPEDYQVKLRRDPSKPRGWGMLGSPWVNRIVPLLLGTLAVN